MLDLNKNILAIDIGKGTEDIFYYEPQRKLENCIQIIRPSQAQLLKQQLDHYRVANYDIFIDGTIMGGEPWHNTLYKIAQMPNREVIMTPSAARSLRYNLDQVKSRGVKILDHIPSKTDSNQIHLETYDIDFQWYGKVFNGIDINIFRECDVLLLACQEHGYPGPNGGSVREFRMRECYQRFLDTSPVLTSLMFEYLEIPDFAWRFKANADLAREFFPQAEIFLMDSSPAVVLGTMLDPKVPDGLKTVINIGNGHTLVMVLNSKWEILAVWEHHTGGLSTSSLDEFLEKLFSNRLSHEFVLQQGGHGFYKRIREISSKAANNIIVLGPNRDIIKESKFTDSIIWSHPLGSMMLSGPAGLLKTYEIKSKKGI
jgi:uncharacterized protein (DUF1786 family)